MKRILLAGLLVALVLAGAAGCGVFTKPADTVSFDRVQMALTMGDLQAPIAVLEFKAAGECQAGRFSTATCLQIQELVTQARALKAEIVAALLDPTVQIDWAKVAAVIKLAIQIAMKFA